MHATPFDGCGQTRSVNEIARPARIRYRGCGIEHTTGFDVMNSSAKRNVEVAPRSYQPSKAELEAEVKIDASPKQLAKALMKPVTVREKAAPASHK